MADLGRLHDRLYRLEAAVEDVRADLEGTPSPADYRRAFEHLLDACRGPGRHRRGAGAGLTRPLSAAPAPMAPATRWPERTALSM